MSAARMAITAKISALLFVLFGCEEAPPAERVAEKAVPSLDTVPALLIIDTIPEAEPRLMLPNGATVLSNGTVVVSDQWGQSVRFFDRSGNLSRTVGRGGEGPGEFAAPWWLGQCGPDSVFVWDYMHHQMTIIDSAGTVVREYRPSTNPTWFRCSRSGKFAVFGMQVDMPRSTSMAEVLASVVMAPLRFEDAVGDSLGGVGILPQGENWILGRLTQYAITEDRLYVGTADSAALDVYDLGGTRLGSIPLSITARSPSDQNIESWLDAQVEASNDAAQRERMKQMIRQRSKVPEHLPLYTGLAVDPEGMIWVVLSSPGDGETRFHVVDSDGTLLADLRIPTEFKLYEVGRDYLLGGVHHETGVPGIALYRVHRASR